MKKIFTISIIVVVVLIGAIYLFKLSPQQQAEQSSVNGIFNQTKTGELKTPTLVVADDHILGNPNAKNTMVIYEDIQCPACAAFEPVLKEIPKQLNDTKVVFRHFPLLGLHKNSGYAALAVEAASAQGKFWEFTFNLYENQNLWSDLENPVDQFGYLAAKSGVANIDQFKNDVINHKYKDRVQTNLTEAINLGVDATPTLYFNDNKLQIGGIEEIKKQVQGMYIK